MKANGPRARCTLRCKLHPACSAFYRFWNEKPAYVLVFKMPDEEGRKEDENRYNKERKSCEEMVKFLKEKLTVAVCSMSIVRCRLRGVHSVHLASCALRVARCRTTQ